MGRRHDHPPGRSRPHRARDLPGHHVRGRSVGSRARLGARHPPARVADALEHVEGPGPRGRGPRRQRIRVADRRPHARRHHRRGRPVTDGVRDVPHVGTPAAGLRRHGSRERLARARRDAPLPDVRGPVHRGRHQPERLLDLPDADRPSKRRLPGGRRGYGGDLPGPGSRGAAPRFDDDRADGAHRVRPGRAAGRPRLRGIRCTDRIPRRGGLRTGPARARGAGQPGRPGRPTVAAR